MKNWIVIVTDDEQRGLPPLAFGPFTEQEAHDFALTKNQELLAAHWAGGAVPVQLQLPN